MLVLRRMFSGEWALLFACLPLFSAHARHTQRLHYSAEGNLLFDDFEVYQLV